MFVHQGSDSEMESSFVRGSGWTSWTAGTRKWKVV